MINSPCAGHGLADRSKTNTVQLRREGGVRSWALRLGPVGGARESSRLPAPSRPAWPGGPDVAECSPYETDLDWLLLSEPDEMAEVLEQLGRATAKVHCVLDVDDDSPLVEFQVEDAICAVVSDRVDEFVADLTGFSVSYAAQVRRDHALFVDAFRNDRIEGVPASVAMS